MNNKKELEDAKKELLKAIGEKFKIFDLIEWIKNYWCADDAMFFIGVGTVALLLSVLVWVTLYAK